MRAVTPPAVLAAVVFLHICARDGRWVAAQYDSRFESSLNWPLCGFNTESTTAPTNAEEGHYLVNEGTTAFPDGWTPIDGCPASRRGASSAADAPVRSAFGPRPLYSDNSRYDFHRGIDLASPVGTPMFALTEGTVIHAGEHSSYDDPVIIVRHIRPGATSCSSGEGCYHAMYLHARAMSVGNGCCAVAEDDTVVAGQLLGWTGVSLSGFAHLHFEIRDTTVDDPFSYWQRDAINPLGSLPYSNAAGVSATVEPGGAPAGSSVVPWTVTVTTARHDVMGVRLDVMDQSTGTIVVQPGNTENAEGYLVYPTSFMFDEWNRQYTHKDSDSVTWASFGEGGERECPFHAAHGNSYDAHVHLDSATESDASVGEFNGIRVVLESHEYYAAGDYYIRVTFTNVQLPDGAGGLEGVGSARATVYLGSSDPVTTTWSLPSPTAAPTNTAAPTPAPTTTTAAPTPAPTTTTAAPTPAPTTTIAAPTPAPTIATAAPTPAPTTITAAPTPAPTTATAAPTAATAAPTPVPTTTTAASATTTVAPTPAPTTTAAAPTPAPTTTPATPTPASTTTTLVPTPAPTTTTTPAPTTTIASVSNPSLTSTTAAPTPALTTTTIPPTPAPTTTSTTTTPAPTPPTTSITTSSNAPTPAPTPTSTTSPSSMPSPATPPKIQTDSPTTPVPTVSASSPGGAPEVKAMAALIPDAAGRVSSSTITPWPAYQRYCTDIGGHDPNVTSCAMSCTPFLQLEGVVVGGSGDEGEAAADELEYHWYSDLDSSDGTGGGCVQFLDSLDGDAVDCLPISPGESFPAATGSSLCYGRVTRPSAASSFPNVTVLVRGGAVETPDCRVYLVLDDLANGLLSGNGESENSLSGTGTLELRAESGFGGTEEAPALGDYHVSGSQDTSITDSFTVISSGYTYHLVQWDGATESPTTGSPLPFGSVEQTVLPYDCLEVAATGTAACAIVYGDGSAGIAAEDGAFVATPAEPSADAFSGERGTVACSFAYSLTSGYGVCQPAKLQVRAVQHNPCPALDDSCHQVASASFDIACDDRTPSGLAPALGGPAEDGVSTAVCPAGRTPARCHAVTANPSAAQPDVAFTRFVERDGVTVCEAAQTDTADMRALALCTDEELVTVTSSLGAGEGEVSASCKDGGKVYGCAAWCSEDNTCLFGRQTEAECVYTSTGEIEVQVRCAPVREAPPPTILGNAAVSELEESAQVVVVFTTIKFRSTASGSFAAELRSAASETLAAAAGVPEGRVILLPMKDDAESGGDVTLNVLVVFHAETESEREAAFIVQLTTSASSIFEGDLAFNDYEILDQATVTRSQTTYGKYQLWPAVIEATKDAESGCRALRATTVLLVLTCLGALVM